MRYTTPRAPREWTEFGLARLAAMKSKAVEALIATPLGIVPAPSSIRLRRIRRTKHTQGGSHE